MPSNQRIELISASFHFLVRMKFEGGGESEHPFSKEEFGKLASIIQNHHNVDTKTPEGIDQIKFGTTMLLDSFEIIDERMVFGRYHKGYWGHETENSIKGTIPRDSVTFRPFYYLLYISESGRIYLGSQYLGQYGGYGDFSHFIKRKIGAPSQIRSRSFRVEFQDLSKVVVKEIRVNVSKKSSSSAKGNKFGSVGMFAVKNDSEEPGEVQRINRSVLNLFPKPSAEKRSGIAKIFAGSELFDFDDGDIEDCTLVVREGHSERIVSFFEKAGLATKFPMDVPTGQNGHPLGQPTKQAMINLFAEQILSKKENV